MVNGLKSIFVQEQRRYTLNQLSLICNVSEEEITPVIKKLREHGIIKVIRDSDEQCDISELLDDTSEFIDTDGNLLYYVFSFVGVVIVSRFVFKVYPKYIKENNKEKELKLILKVLEKHNKESEVLKQFSDTKESMPLGLLSLFLFFIQYYYENGSYRNTEVVFESNGQGEINWDNTINKSYAIVCNNQPFDLDVQTRKRIDDESDYIKRLHECIITMASKELDDAGLLNLFDLPRTDLSDESIEDFGDKDFILYRLKKELNVQFILWKQVVLKAMYSYIAGSGTLSDINCLSAYGTTCFNLVWEHVCSEVLDNKLKTPLKDILPREKLIDKYKNASLLDIIEKPLWTFTGKMASDTLKPDIVSIEEIGGRPVFAIIDAKYYDPILVQGKIPQKQPGIESVTKQYLYQLAYTEFIKEQGFMDDCIINCFVFPAENYVCGGEVKMKMLSNLPVSPKLKDIDVFFVRASEYYRYYIDSKKMSIKLLLDYKTDNKNYTLLDQNEENLRGENT